MDLAIDAFNGLKENQILICSEQDQDFTFLKVNYSIEGDPPDTIKLDDHKHILVIIYHHVIKKDYNYLIKLAWFFVPASNKFDVNGACALIYKNDYNNDKEIK